MKKFISLVLFLFSIAVIQIQVTPLIANESNELAKAFHASSALLSYIEGNRKLCSGTPEGIVFTDNDVEALWRRLQRHSEEAALPQLLQAEAEEKRGKLLLGQGDSSAAKHAFTSARKLLFPLHMQWREQRLPALPPASTTAPAGLLAKDVVNLFNLEENLNNNPYISAEMRAFIRPYLFPADHPLLFPIQVLFSSRITADKNSLAQIGFTTHYVKPRSFIHVVSHPWFPNYLLKLQLDTELRRKAGEPEWIWFARRCRGAEQVIRAINKIHTTSFSAPQKYLFPLPYDQPIPGPGPYLRKFFVLFVQDMHLVPKRTNEQAWKTKFTRKMLDELYKIISLAGGSSYRPDNIWLTTSNQFAFIDTEYPYRSPNFATVAHFLSQPMRAYWNRLVTTGGP